MFSISTTSLFRYLAESSESQKARKPESAFSSCIILDKKVLFCCSLSFVFSSSIQTVYLSDEEFNLVAIKFWGGLKVFSVLFLIL